MSPTTSARTRGSETVQSRFLRTTTRPSTPGLIDTAALLVASCSLWTAATYVCCSVRDCRATRAMVCAPPMTTTNTTASTPVIRHALVDRALT